VANDTYNQNALQVGHVHLERRPIDAVGKIGMPQVSPSGNIMQMNNMSYAER